MASSTRRAPTPALEVGLLLDTTGSMSPYIGQAKSRARELVKKIHTFAPGTRLAVVGYGDHCDGRRMMTTLPLTTELERAARFIPKLPGTGGGDFPEAIECVVRAARAWPWRSEARRLILIGDAPGHGWSPQGDNGCPDGVDLRQEISALAAEGLVLHAVQCGQNAVTRSCFEWMARTTGGRYLTLAELKDTVDLVAALCAAEVGAIDDFAQSIVEAGELTASKEAFLIDLGASCY